MPSLQPEEIFEVYGKEWTEKDRESYYPVSKASEDEPLVEEPLPEPEAEPEPEPEPEPEAEPEGDAEKKDKKHPKDTHTPDSPSQDTQDGAKPDSGASPILLPLTSLLLALLPVYLL